jgi:hypothetical protein
MIQAPAVSAQTNSNLRLVITEEGGQPLVGANVLLFAEGATDYTAYGVTSRDGFVEFRNIQQGRYLIRVSFIGFETIETMINVERGATVVVRLRLQEIVGRLDEVEVVGEDATRTGVAGITRIRGEDFRRVPSASIEGDLMSYLQTMPGVITTGDQGGELYIRGGTPAQNMVLVDGIPVVKPFHISNLFSAFPERAVNDVTVMAGGYDSRYLGSTSAVMDVNLRTANLNEASASASFSPFLSTLYLETPVNQNLSSVFVSGRHSNIRQFPDYPGTQNLDMEFFDVVARYSLQADEIMCSVSALATGDRGNINPARNLDLSWTNTGAGIRCFGYDAAFRYPFEVSLGYSGFTNREGTDQGTERFASVKQGYLRLGLQAEFFKMDMDYGVNILFQAFRAEFAERLATYNDGFDRKVSTIQLFAKTKWEPGRWFALEPGIGSQLAIPYGMTFEPRLRVRYNPFRSSRTELSFASGIYSQIMGGISDYRDAGSTFTAYKPVRQGDPLQLSYHTILGLRNRLGGHWVVNIESYYKWHQNLPVPRWSQQAGIETETAFANGETWGFDIRLEYQTDPLYWYAGYGFGKVEYTAAGDDLGNWLSGTIQRFSPSHDQRHKVNTHLNYHFRGFSAKFSLEFGSGLPYTQIFATDLILRIPYEIPARNPGIAYGYYDRPNAERLPVYHRLDVSVQRYFDVMPGFRIGAEIGAINLYDRENIFYLDVVSFAVVNQSGFLPYISISATL